MVGLFTEQRIGKGVEGSSCDLIEIMPWNLSGGTEDQKTLRMCPCQDSTQAVSE
jgi:hypothetical protein